MSDVMKCLSQTLTAMIVMAFLWTFPSHQLTAQQVSDMGDSVGIAQICSGLEKFRLWEKSHIAKHYTPRGGKILANGKLLALASVPESGRGRVIQSVSFQASPCSMIASSSMGGKPEKLNIWKFQSSHAPEAIARTTKFGHGSDLSRQVDEEGKEWFWITDKTGKGVNRFTLAQTGESTRLDKIQNIQLFDRKLHNLIIGTSVDNQHLVVIGTPVKQGFGKLKARIYELSALDISKTVRSQKDRTKQTPLHEWSLHGSQRVGRQWRQGIAAIGQSIFVLTGNSKPNSPKLLVTYDLKGHVLSKQEIRVGKQAALKDGSHYEPEGLEIVHLNGEPRLAIGIASGQLGARVYRLWAIPLTELAG